MINVALTLDKLVPQVEYGGSLTDNTKESYDKLRWEDSRPKPSWNDIETEWSILSIELKKQDCKNKAKELLQNSDWSEIPSVVQQLENSIEWVNYRIAVIQYIINPVEEPNFPQEPKTIWKA